MARSVCPWWLGYLLTSPVRRWMQDPDALLAPYVREGMTVLEPGPGMGFFTLPLARAVGDTGRVIAVDIQQKMLTQLRRRAVKAGLSSRIEARLATEQSLGIGDLANKVDFTLVFAMLHEMPSATDFFAQAAKVSKPEAALLLVEPSGHVSASAFEKELQDGVSAGFAIKDRPAIRRNHAALLTRT